MKGSKIDLIDYYFPSEILSNDDLNEIFPEWDAGKIETKVGIKSRHIAGEKDTALSMGIEAGRKVCSKIELAKIDYVIFCTQSPEYFLPSGACIIQDILGLRKDIGAIDINLGCSGYVYGLSLADSLIKSEQASKVLLITSETYSKHIHPQDKGNRSIFGDAATATIISTSDKPKIGKFVFGTDGSGFNKLIVRKGAFNSEKVEKLYEKSTFPEEYLYMNGPDIFNFTMEVVPDLVEKCLLKNDIDKVNVDMFIFHQANKYILNFLRKSIKIEKEKFYINLENTGNTVSSTIPIAFKQCLDDGLIKTGDKIMLVGFGVGLSWASTIIEV